MKQAGASTISTFPAGQRAWNSGVHARPVPKIEVAKLVLVLLLLAMLAQEAALAYGHVMYRAVEALPDVVYRGMVLLLPFGAFALFVVYNHPCLSMPKGFGLMFTLFTVSSLMSVALSFSTSHELKYVLGDSLRFMGPWITFYLSYQSFRLVYVAEGAKTLLGWYDWLAYIALLDGLMTICFGLTFFGFHISNWFYVFLIGWAVLSDRHPEIVTNLTFGTVLLATVTSHKRTNFALVGLAFVMAIALRVVRGGQVLRLCGSLCGMIIAGILAQTVLSRVTGDASIFEVSQKMIENIRNNVLEGEVENSYLYRINEVKNVEAYFEEHPWMSILGVGFGGEIPMLFDAGPGSATAEGNLHHIHKGYWLYYLRNGWVGLLLLALFAWTSTIGLLCGRSAAPLITASCATYAATRLLASFGGNLMMEDLDLPLVLGLGFAFVDSGPAAMSQVPKPQVSLR